MAANPLRRLATHGQSVWIDYLSRDLIQSGELQRMVNEDGIRGLTSNPSILEKSLSNAPSYDEDLKELAGGNLSAAEVLFRLAAADIRSAADILRPLYQESAGHDGFVSLELPPALAHDSDGSIKTAIEQWRVLDRPNVMLKVPATPAGIPVIEELIAEGININVTLIFSLSAYEAVAWAYMRGLQRRLAKGQPLHPRSVASFFVSRIDVAVDKLLEGQGRTDLAGQAAIASARLLYQAFERLFYGPDFARLRSAGAAVQRPLWASTSPKSRAYPDTMYVEALVGPDSISTMPPETLAAFKDHGQVSDVATVREGLSQARALLPQLAAAGIDMEIAGVELLREGLQKFADAYQAALQKIEQRTDSIADATVNLRGTKRWDERDQVMADSFPASDPPPY